jgi:hypothetical protein
MRCPLCGAINSTDNDECFVCTWHGAFEHDTELVEEGLAELLEHCPELEEVILDTPSVDMVNDPSVRGFLRRLFWPS